MTALRLVRLDASVFADTKNRIGVDVTLDWITSKNTSKEVERT